MAQNLDGSEMVSGSQTDADQAALDTAIMLKTTRFGRR